MNKQIIATEERRIDQYLASIETISREQIKKLINDGQITVNNEKVRPSYILNEGDLIEIISQLEDPLKPVNLNLDIIYEDDYLLVVYKPKGLVVHPSPSLNENTLVNHLLYYSKNLSNLSGEQRPGIVHRLDKDTSGLLVVAKTNEIHQALVEQFQENSVKRLYEAICLNPFNELAATIDMPIKRDENNKTKMTVDPTGKRAITKLTVLQQNEFYSYLECELITGRTHQIRVHLAHIGHPIVGDETYGKKNKSFTNGQLLHAKKLSFIHPVFKKEMEFTYPLPNDFTEALKRLNL